MDVFKAIETRRSIRKYQGRRIPDDVMHRILEAGRMAPSAANRQPWAVIVVRDPDTRQLLVKACNDCDFVGKCDAFIACIGDPQDKWYEVDGGIVLENIALTAWENGIGSCYIGYYDGDYLKSLLHIPQNLEVVACMTLGYPDETPDARPRKNFQDLFYMEKYSSRGSSPPF